MFLGDLVSSEISAAEEMDFSCVRRTLVRRKLGRKGWIRGNHGRPVLAKEVNIYELIESQWETGQKFKAGRHCSVS